MPFKSAKQRAYLYANEPAVAKRWQREYGTPKRLLKRVKKRKKTS